MEPLTSAPVAATTTDETAGGAVGPPPASSLWDRPLSDRALAVIVAVVSLPIFWMGWGTDIDVPNVLRVTEVIRSGDYEPSRPPGVPVVEVLAALLEPVGGHILVNLATVAAAAALVVGIARLVRQWDHPNGDLIALAFFVSPITIIASTSLADFVWALAFFVWGALAYLRHRWVVTGLLFALAMGSRISTAFVIAAFLAADLWGTGWWSPQHRRALRALATAGALTVLLYVPSWLYYDRSSDILKNEDGFRGFANNLGRFLYKNYAVAGIALIVVVLIALPALVGALRGWKADPLLRFGVLTLVVTEALFFQMPWKPAHLLPCLLGLLLWMAAAERSRRFLWLVVGAVALNGFVSLRPLAPENPDDTTGASWDPAVEAGLLVNDVRCRLDVMDVEPDADDPEWDAWSCTLKPMRGAVAEETEDGE